MSHSYINVIPSDPFAVVFEGNTSGSDEFPVNLRKVWEVMGSKRKFADWKTSRTARLVEGEHFTSFHAFVKRERKDHGASVRKEIYVTLDVAKAIAMMENNERGDRLRDYFIEVEKRWRNSIISQLQELQTQVEGQSQLADQISLERFRLVDPGTPRPGQHQLRRGCWVKSKKRNEKALEFHGAKGAVQLLMTALLDGASQFQLEECGESRETGGAEQQKRTV